MSDKLSSVTLTKKESIPGGKRGSGLSTCLSGKGFTWLLLLREFSGANFYTFEIFGKVGRNLLLCVDWFLAWYVVSSEA